MFKKGYIPWDKGLTKETDIRVKNAAIKRSKTLKGVSTGRSWNKGLTKETDERVKGNALGISKGLKGKRLSLKHRKALKESHNTLEYRNNGLKRAVLAQGKIPSSYEKRIMELVKKYKLPYKYVGDGKVWIDGKNPDFINVNHQKIIVEVYANWRHPKNYENRRAKFFAKYGYKVIFINEKDLLVNDWEERCLNKVLDSITY